MVNVHIKSGGNSIHGLAFGFNMNTDTTARPFFAPASQCQPKNIDNDFGGTIGGPIVKNRLFYFVSYDGKFIRQNSGKYVTVPDRRHPGGRLMRLAHSDLRSLHRRRGWQRPHAVPRQYHPPYRISPIALKLEAITPLPNIPGRADQQLLRHRRLHRQPQHHRWQNRLPPHRQTHPDHPHGLAAAQHHRPARLRRQRPRRQQQRPRRHGLRRFVQLRY